MQTVLLLQAEWEITSKVAAIVTDNAKNMVNTISLLSEVSDNTKIYSVTCASHTVQLDVNHTFKRKNHATNNR